jgi:hypothetical protein
MASKYLKVVIVRLDPEASPGQAAIQNMPKKTGFPDQVRESHKQRVHLLI